MGIQYLIVPAGEEGFVTHLTDQARIYGKDEDNLIFRHYDDEFQRLTAGSDPDAEDSWVTVDEIRNSQIQDEPEDMDDDQD